MPQTSPVTKSQFLVTLEGLDFYWETFSGLKDSAQTTEYSDGLTLRTFRKVGRRNLEEMQLSKAFDPVADKPIVDWYLTYCEGQGVEKTASITPVQYCPDPEPIGPTLTFYGVKPVSLEGFEADKKSADIMMLTLSFIADYYEYA